MLRRICIDLDLIIAYLKYDLILIEVIRKKLLTWQCLIKDYFLYWVDMGILVSLCIKACNSVDSL